MADMNIRNVSDAFLRAQKIRALQRGLTLREYVIEVLEAGVESHIRAESNTAQGKAIQEPHSAPADYETVVQKAKEQPRREDEVFLDYSESQADNPVKDGVKLVVPPGLSNSEAQRWIRDQAQEKLQALRKARG